MPDIQTLLTGLAFGESPRWHNGRLWVADWGAQEILAVDLEGKREVIVKVSFPSFPMCYDWPPDGAFLIVSSRNGLLLRLESGGSLVTHADLGGLSEKGHLWNEIVIDGRGNAYINNQGFDFPGGQFAPGMIALVTPNGAVRQVADGIAFPSAHGCHSRQRNIDRGCFACMLDRVERYREYGRWVTNRLDPHGSSTGTARRMAVAEKQRRRMSALHSLSSRGSQLIWWLRDALGAATAALARAKALPLNPTGRRVGLGR